MTSSVLYSVQYHRQRCTPQAFEQFGALYMHNPDDKHPIRPGFEPSTCEFRAKTGPNETSGPARYGSSSVLDTGPANTSRSSNVSLTLSLPNYSIWIFTHLKLFLADAIHNIKWMKIIQIWQNGGQLFSNIADWCGILSLTCLKGGT